MHLLRHIIPPRGSEGRWWCFDANRRVNQFGRYMNIAPGNMANATAVPPYVVVEGRLRLAFTATKPIQAGDEITWDYGVCGEPWLSKQGNTLVNTNTKHFICMRSHPATHLAPRWRYALKPLQTIPCFNQSDQQSYHFLLGSTQQPIPPQDHGILSTSQVVNAPTNLLTTAYIHENMLSVYQCL